jgi:hypothetical protein
MYWPGWQAPASDASIESQTSATSPEVSLASATSLLTASPDSAPTSLAASFAESLGAPLSIVASLASSASATALAASVASTASMAISAATSVSPPSTGAQPMPLPVSSVKIAPGQIVFAGDEHAAATNANVTHPKCFFIVQILFKNCLPKTTHCP